MAATISMSSTICDSRRRIWFAPNSAISRDEDELAGDRWPGRGVRSKGMNITGETLEVEQQGDGDAVLMVHGLGGTSNTWYAQRAAADRQTMLPLSTSAETRASRLAAVAEVREVVMAPSAED